MNHMGKAIIVVGLAAVSAYLVVNGVSNGAAAWALLAVLILFFA